MVQLAMYLPRLILKAKSPKGWFRFCHSLLPLVTPFSSVELSFPICKLCVWGERGDLGSYRDSIRLSTKETL